MRKIFPFFISFILFFSCVSKNKYENSLEENERLNNKILELNKEIKILNKNYQKLKLNFELEKSKYSHLKKLVDNKNKKEEKEKKEENKYYTEKEALDFLKDFYNFYESGTFYKNPRVKRLSNNTFDISLEEKYSKNGYWHPMVRQLIIKENGEYEML